MKKILILLSGNILYDARVSKEIASLRKFGYSVVLVQTHKLGENKINDYPVYVINKQSSDNMNFTKIWEIVKFSNELNKIIKKENPDYIHCNDVGTLVYALRFVKTKKVVYDSHDLAIECVIGIKNKIIKYIEYYMVPYLHAIIIPQIDRLRYFSFRYPKAKGKLYLLENFPTKFVTRTDDLFETELKIKRGNRKLVLYTGALNNERKVKELIGAIKDINELLLVLIGFSSDSYRKELEDMINQNKLEERVYILNPLPHQMIKKLAVSADIGVCFYDDPNLNSYFCASNKLYELMDSGTLVLTNDTVGAMRVVRAENGVVIPDTSVESIVTGFHKLVKLDNPPKMQFFWESQEEVLRHIYR